MSAEVQEQTGNERGSQATGCLWGLTRQSKLLEAARIFCRAVWMMTPLRFWMAHETGEQQVNESLPSADAVDVGV